MNSKMKTEKQCSIKEFTDWELRDCLGKIYDDMGFDEEGNLLTREDKEHKRREEQSKLFNKILHEMLLKNKKENKWVPTNDRKL